MKYIMKYVRTKEGKIWSLSNPDNNYLYKGRDTEHGKCPHEIGESFREADTLEEVCDYFIVWQEDYETPVPMPLSEKDKYEMMKDIIALGKAVGMKCWLKLAIWVDDGLKYVAEMNGKKDLELL